MREIYEQRAGSRYVVVLVSRRNVANVYEDKRAAAVGDELLRNVL